MILIIIGFVVVAYLIRKYFQNVYSFWDKENVPTAPTYKYFFGHMIDLITFKKAFGDIFSNLYRESEGYNYVGLYKFQVPMLLVRSPEIVKDVLIRDFNSFYNNDFPIDEKSDFIMGNNPFALKAPKWKEVRSQVTPSFSSSKIKQMVSLIQENCNKLVEYIANTPESVNETGIDSKELCSKFTCENVASCAFGLNGGAFTNPKSEFREVGRAFTNPSALDGMKFLLVFVFPSLLKLIKLRVFTVENETFLRNLVVDTLQYRKTNKIVRNDFLDFMVALREKINDETVFNEEDILAHAGGFIVDGFETSSVAMSYMIYEIGANTNVQERLKNEIDEILEKYNEEITFEAVQEMKYLECVVKESLRMHPPLRQAMKVCTQDYKLPPCDSKHNGQSVIKTGTTVVISIHGMHMDPKYFPEPERFDPDRFSDENKDNIIKYTYLPFGEGPRMCLGMKFAQLQLKMGIIAIVSKYEIKINKKTQEPLKSDPLAFLSAPIGGMWINFNKRN